MSPSSARQQQERQQVPPETPCEASQPAGREGITGARASGPPCAVMAAEKISIVAACRNEAKHIREFIDSVLAQDLAGLDWEFIVADGQSNDGTAEILAEIAARDSRIVLIENPARAVGSGLNAAIRIASGAIVLRMDAHTEYAPDYVKKCLHAMKSTGAQNVGGPARTKAEGLWPRAIQSAYHSRFSTGGARFHDENFSGYVDTVPYGCWRRETLEQLGLYDERLIRNQDDELNLRLIRAGGKIWQSSEIVSWYRPRTSLSSLFQQYFQYGFWKVPVIRKHKVPGAWRHLVPGTFVLANIFLPLAAVVSLLVGDAPLMKLALLAWALLAGTYALAVLTASIFAAKQRGWGLFPYLPLCFAVFHVSYGLGFALGLIYWPFAKPGGSKLGAAFVGISR